MPGEKRERRRTVIREEHAIAVAGQNRLRELTNPGFVIDEEDDAVVAPRNDRFGRARRSGLGVLFRGQENLEGGAARFAVNANESIVAADNSRDGGKPEPGPLPDRFGGEKRIENFIDNRRSECRCRYR